MTYKNLYKLLNRDKATSFIWNNLTINKINKTPTRKVIKRSQTVLSKNLSKYTKVRVGLQ